MKLVDANVLLYAVNADAVHHERSRAWLDRALSGGAGVGFAWVPLLAFLRLGTKPEVFARPLSVAEAHGVLDSWLAQPSARILSPTSRHPELLASLMGATGSGGNLVNDAHLAALSIEHRAEVITFDRDFGRFPGVRWAEPS